MPHFIVHCSENILDHHSKQDVCQFLFKTALDSALFKQADIKVRVLAFRANEYTIAGTNEAFAHIFAHIMEGRTGEQKDMLAKKMVDALYELFPSVPNLSINIEDFKRPGYYKHSPQ